MKNEDLLDIKPKKDLKKPLIYGGIAFLIFIIVIIAIALFQNSTSKKEENEIIPPETTQKVDNFKPLIIEEKPLVDETNEKKSEKKEDNNSLKDKKEKFSIQTPILEEKNAKEEIKSPKKEAPQQIEKELKVVNKNYYIQVAALLKNTSPNKKFLELIKKQGFNYKLYKIFVKRGDKKIRVTKILIGPFTKDKAKRVLPKIKKTISKAAFILRVKNGI